MAYTSSQSSASSSRPLWKDPFFWGAAISLGMHGLLWVIVPLLPSAGDRTEDEVQRPVELVELGPAEQDRLPDFLTDDIRFPQTAPPQTFTNDFTTDPIPAESPLPMTPQLPPFLIPPPSPPDDSRDTQLNQRRQDLFSPSSENQDSSTSVAIESPDPPTEADDPSPEATESPEPTDPSPLPAIPPQLQALIQEQESQSERFTFDDTGTTNQEAIEAFVEWGEAAVAALGDDYNDSDAYSPSDAPVVEVTAPYPVEACIRNLSLEEGQEVVQGTAVLGVVTQPGGFPMDDPAPQVLRSSGYAFLNDRAKEIAMNEELYEIVSRRVGYQVYVTFPPEGAERCPEILQNFVDENPG